MRTFFRLTGPHAFFAVIFLALMAIISAAGNLSAQTPPQAIDNYRVEIGQAAESIPGDTVSIPVIKTAGSEKFKGFDLLIAYDTSYLSIVGIDPGEPFAIPGIYEWEYFTHRTGSMNCYDSSCPTGFARFVSLTDINNGTHHPLLETLPDGTVLFTIHFRVEHDLALDCSAAPVRFYWIDCGDNAIAFGEILPVGLAVSDSVFDFQGINITDFFRLIPSYYGAPFNCIDSIAPNPPVRAVTFVNGKIDFYCPGTNPIKIGDINLNGIPYESGDAEIFRDYMRFGHSALTINMGDQILSSDTKKDDNFLTVEDYVYLNQVRDGALPPWPNYAPMTFEHFGGILMAVNTDSSIIIQTSFEDSVAALHIKFYAPDLQNYRIKTFPPLDSLNLFSGLNNDTLRILLHGPLPPIFGFDSTGSGALDIMEIVYTGTTPSLWEASAAGYYGQHVNLAKTTLPNMAPMFVNVPDTLINVCYGGFNYTFTAHDSDTPPDDIQFHIVSGPGQINPTTGEWSYIPLCLDTGGYEHFLVLCVSDVAHPCPQSDTTLHVRVVLVLDSLPPIQGDANNSGVVNIIDVSYLIGYLYKHGPAPMPLAAVADVNVDHNVDILDIGYIISFLYRAGPKPLCLDAQ